MLDHLNEYHDRQIDVRRSRLARACAKVKAVLTVQGSNNNSAVSSDQNDPFKLTLVHKNEPLTQSIKCSSESRPVTFDPSKRRSWSFEAEAQALVSHSHGKLSYTTSSSNSTCHINPSERIRDTNDSMTLVQRNTHMQSKRAQNLAASDTLGFPQSRIFRNMFVANGSLLSSSHPTMPPSTMPPKQPTKFLTPKDLDFRPLTAFTTRFTITCKTPRSKHNGPLTLSHFVYSFLQCRALTNATVVLGLTYAHQLCNLGTECVQDTDRLVCGHCLISVCLLLAEKVLQVRFHL